MGITVLACAEIERVDADMVQIALVESVEGVDELRLAMVGCGVRSIREITRGTIIDSAAR